MIYDLRVQEPLKYLFCKLIKLFYHRQDEMDGGVVAEPRDASIR